jgi:hypothetical protein
MKKTVLLLSTVIVAALTACMSPPPRSEDHMVSSQEILPEESEQLQALRDAGKDFSHVITVPAAGNMLSNGVIIGALMMGSGSAPADSLLVILREGKEQAVAVVGKSDALTTATIETAIRQLGDTPTTTTILFAGKSRYVEQLQRATDKAGMPFEGVVFPQPQDQQSQDQQPQDQEPQDQQAQEENLP